MTFWERDLPVFNKTAVTNKFEFACPFYIKTNIFATIFVHMVANTCSQDYCAMSVTSSCFP